MVPTPVAKPSPLPTQATPTPTPVATGQFKITYPEMQTQLHTNLARWLRKQNFPKQQVDEVNLIIALPEDVTVSVMECKAADGTDIMNTLYWKETRTIGLCIGFFTNIALGYYDGKNDDEATGKALSVFRFLLLHEIGHAFVHVLKLPITGREEDTVDQLAVFLGILLTDPKSSASPDAFYAADYFNESLQERNETYADQHGLSQQRLVNFACWVYGQDPKRYSRLIDNGYLPQVRAVECESEYRQIKTAWSRLLAPHIK